MVSEVKVKKPRKRVKKVKEPTTTVNVVVNGAKAPENVEVVKEVAPVAPVADVAVADTATPAPERKTWKVDLSKEEEFYKSVIEESKIILADVGTKAETIVKEVVKDATPVAKKFWQSDTFKKVAVCVGIALCLVLVYILA